MTRTLGRIALALVCFLIALWLVAPTLVIIPISFSEAKSLAFPPHGFSWKWYANIFDNRDWSRSLLTSVEIGLIVAVVATVLGTMAALGLERLKNRLGGAIRLLLLTPVVMPGVVLAVGIYAVYLNIHLTGTWTGYVLAHTLLALPFVVIAVSANLSVFDARLEVAAASLGASRLTVLRTVTVPLIAPGILSGALFAFVTSFDEVIVSLFITSARLKTLPVQIYASMTRDTDPTVAAVGTLTFVATTVLIGAGLVFSLSRGRK